MIIQCEKCRTKFNFDENSLKNEGSKVRCSHCKHVFVAIPPEQIEAEDQPTIVVSAEEQEALEEGTEAGQEEEMGFDDAFEEEPMEDIEDLEAEYQETPLEEAETIDMEVAPIEDSEEQAEEESLNSTEPGEALTEKKKAGKSKTLLIFVLIIAGLLGIAFAVSQWMPELVSDFLTLPTTKQADKQKSTDMGASRLEILTVNGSFVDSEKAGRLFVIRGKVRNSYPKSRSFILVKGNILDNKGQVVKEKSAYAGNAFQENELLRLPLEEINRAMENRHGTDQENLDVKPGTTVDFAIVFEKLPENLSEFTVGAVSSSPGSPETSDRP